MAYKPPRSVAESEELLNGRNPDADTFGFWYGLGKGLLKARRVSSTSMALMIA